MQRLKTPKSVGVHAPTAAAAQEVKTPTLLSKLKTLVTSNGYTGRSRLHKGRAASRGGAENGNRAVGGRAHELGGADVQDAGGCSDPACWNGRDDEVGWHKRGDGRIISNCEKISVTDESHGGGAKVDNTGDDDTPSVGEMVVEGEGNVLSQIEAVVQSEKQQGERSRLEGSFTTAVPYLAAGTMDAEGVATEGRLVAQL